MKILTRDELSNTIKGLAQDFEIIGPRELPNKGIFYQSITSPEDLYLGDEFTIEPIKKFFLSPSEWLFKQDYLQGKEVLEEQALSNKKRLIFGVRPCEARALTLLDRVFDSQYQDRFYINNRARSIIIGLYCFKVDNDCFCISLGGSPVESRGMDAAIFAVGNEFVVDIITDKAKEILGFAGRDIDKKEEKVFNSHKEKHKDGLTRRINVPENLDTIFESPYWDKVCFSCLGCGICTYLCPSCHCFDLVDEKRKRLKCYDGCAFGEFTLQVSGENPRPTKKERYRQRVYHKFNYFKKNFGENLCVGCGRCIRHCPVKMDIADIVSKAPC